MKISYNWLAQFLPIEDEPEVTGDLLTSIGLEVEGIERFESVKGGLEGLVVGEVMECTQHPNADRLKLTKVNVGREELLPIVCGAPNVAAGQKVIIATVGTKLYPSEGEPFEIKKAKIRGEASQGMICAEDEIGTGQSHDGILVLPETTPVGKPALELFDVEVDHVYEIGLTPNRADAASHLGVARDLKAALNHRQGKSLSLDKPSVADFPTNTTSAEFPVEVQNTEACPRYCGVTITGLIVAPSPAWLQHRLRAIGVRPINNIVDVTNYVNHELGQPLHAFDLEKIKDGKVIVKTLPQGTEFKSLDEEVRKLDARDLMICDSQGGMCIAGVFGGAESGVTESTTSIFLESAYFNPVWVRKTAKRHGLHTDASFRFERGIDPNITAYAAKRAALLIAELAGGTISSPLSDTHPEAFPMFEVEYNTERANRFIGLDIPAEASEHILNGLEVEVAQKEGPQWSLKVPPFKVDVTREADVMEEVLRVYGFDEVPTPTQIKSTVKDMKKPQAALARDAASNVLSAQGFLECMSNSMVDENFATLSGEWNEEDVVRLNNPLSSELGIMRPALIVSAMQNAAYNLNRQQANLKLYEFGNIYRTKGEGYREEQRLAIAVGGQEAGDHWRAEGMPADWFYLKSTLEQLASRLGLDMNKVTTVETTNDWFAYGMDWKKGDKVVITAGLVSEKIKKTFDIKKDVFYLELRWDDLLKMRDNEIRIGDLPRFPAVRRDLALLVDAQTEYSRLEQLAYQTERKLLRNVRLFDVYEGKGLPEGKKSYALAFSLRDDSKTLTDKEVDKTMHRLLERFKREVGAELR